MFVILDTSLVNRIDCPCWYFLRQWYLETPMTPLHDMDMAPDRLPPRFTVIALICFLLSNFFRVWNVFFFVCCMTQRGEVIVQAVPFLSAKNWICQHQTCINCTDRRFDDTRMHRQAVFSRVPVMWVRKANENNRKQERCDGISKRVGTDSTKR